MNDRRDFFVLVIGTPIVLAIVVGAVYVWWIEIQLKLAALDAAKVIAGKCVCP